MSSNFLFDVKLTFVFQLRESYSNVFEFTKATLDEKGARNFNFKSSLEVSLMAL